MTAQTQGDGDFNESHTPTRPGILAYGALVGIVVLLSVFLLTA